MARASKLTREELLAASLELHSGETITIVCPECGGGSSRATGLSLTKKENGQIAFICFRDSCQIKGYIKSGEYTPPTEKEKKPKKPREIKVEKLLTEQHSSIPDEIETKILAKYNVSLTKHFCRWDDKSSRVLMPIFDDFFELKGYVARSYDGAEPKALTYRVEGYHGASWHQVGFIPSSHVIIVEDSISAMALVDLGIDAIALLGTNMAPETLQQLSEAFYDKVYIALDYDAFAKSVELIPKLKNANVLALDKDVKDMSLEERKALIAKL